MNERIKELMEPVAWCELTKGGEIGYFDGKPIIMPGKIGNECHPTPLYAALLDAKAIRAEALEEAAKVCDDEQAQLEAMGLDDEAWAAGYCARQIRGLI